MVLLAIILAFAGIILTSLAWFTFLSVIAIAADKAARKAIASQQEYDAIWHRRLEYYR